MTNIKGQLALDMGLKDDATLASFYPGPNREAWQAVAAWVRGLGEPFLYLWGPEGVGKTHLLQAACLAANDRGCPAMLLPLEQDIKWDLLSDVERIPVVCVDNIQSIEQERTAEERLFGVFNAIRQAQGRLLMSATLPPSQLNLSLPDLQSRLTWGLVYRLEKLSDAEKIEALQLRAQCRGLTLSPAVGHFLLTHYARDMKNLFLFLEKLDKASLAKQRKLTIPFVRTLLHE